MTIADPVVNSVIPAPGIGREAGSDVETLSVSVILPVHNGGAAFEKAAQAVLAAMRHDDELIVIADGSVEADLEFCRCHGLTLLTIDEAKGPAFARNLGASSATGDMLFFVDADVVIRSSTIRDVVERFEEDPGLSALIGSYDDEPGDRRFLSQYRNLLHHYTHQNASEDAATFWGACGAVRRDVFQALNGFGEQYALPCVEDIELGYRMNYAGHRIVLARDIQVKHLKRWTPWMMLRTDVIQRAVPWTEAMLRHSALHRDLNLRTENRLSVGAVFLLVAAICLSWWSAVFLMLGLLAAVALLVLNARFYSFLARKRDVLFTLAAIPWHWFYYLYGGVGFVVGSLRHLYRAITRIRQSFQAGNVGRAIQQNTMPEPDRPL